MVVSQLKSNREPSSRRSHFCLWRLTLTVQECHLSNRRQPANKVHVKTSSLIIMRVLPVRTDKSATIQWPTSHRLTRHNKLWSKSLPSKSARALSDHIASKWAGHRRSQLYILIRQARPSTARRILNLVSAIKIQIITRLLTTETDSKMPMLSLPAALHIRLGLHRMALVEVVLRPPRQALATTNWCLTTSFPSRHRTHLSRKSNYPCAVSAHKSSRRPRRAATRKFSGNISNWTNVCSDQDHLTNMEAVPRSCPILAPPKTLREGPREITTSPHREL